MIKKLRVTVDGKSYEVTVEMADESGPAAAPPSAVSAPVSAPVSVSAPAASSPPAPKGPAAPGDVPSPLSGRVVAVDAKVGQEVKEGDKLVTIETMKMNTYVCAPKAGKVSEVLVAVGDTADEGRILVRLS